MLFYLICYDISDNQRRKKISDILEGYGTRVQYSVFECILNVKQYKELQKKIAKIYQSQEDNLRFYPISSHTLSQVEVWGVSAKVTQVATSVII